MRKHIKRACICLVLVVGVLLSACNLSSNIEDSNIEDTSNTDTDNTINMYDESGNLRFAIVRGSISGSTRDAIFSLIDTYMASGTEVQYYDEYDYAKSEYEMAIYVGLLEGDTEQASFMRSLRDSLHYDDFVIKAYKGDIYILGGGDDSTAAAVGYFAEQWATQRTLSAELYYSQCQNNCDLPNMTIDGISVGKFVIVYDNDSYYSKELAANVQEFLYRKTGYMLDVTGDKAKQSEHEILVGCTNRAESSSATEKYSEPNVNYTLKTDNGKLVLANEGYRTGNAVYRALMSEMQSLTADNCDLKLDKTQNIRKASDAQMGERAIGTDIRLMEYNVCWLLAETNTNGFTDAQRAELITDTILLYSPDIIDFNEFKFDSAINNLLRGLLNKYYDFPTIVNPNAGMNELKEGKLATVIALKKSSALKVTASGVEQIAKNDYFHTASWVLVQTSDGHRFINVNVHFLENKENGEYTTKYSQVVTELVSKLKSEYGDVPIMMAGDWYFWKGIPPYSHIINNGFADASETAQNKYSPSHGSINHMYDGTAGTELDIVFITANSIQALAHKIPLDYATHNGSDHFPVIVDLKFK